MRALAYAALFTGLVLVLLPSRFVRRAGLGPAELPLLPRVAGLALAVLGAALALWCVLAFALRGRGTPAPFDPPRRLVTSGPYRFVRNPMYAGAVLALAGAALALGSPALLAFAALFLLAAHAFVVGYEEPALRRAFGDEYRAYCERVARWSPRGRRTTRSAPR